MQPFRPGEKLVLATHNKGKYRENAALLAPFGLEVLSAGELGLLEPEETGSLPAGAGRAPARPFRPGSAVPRTGPG